LSLESGKICRPKEQYRYMQIFENKGAMMGCSNPHPHSQIWSISTVPSLPAKELASLLRYSLSEVSPSAAPRGAQNRPCLLCEYAHFETSAADDTRIVTKNEHWVALVPWWAVWPFEILRSSSFQTTCAFLMSPHRGRKVQSCRHAFEGRSSLRQSVFLLICV